MAWIRNARVGNVNGRPDGAVESGVPVAANAKSRHRKTLAIVREVGLAIGANIIGWALALVSTWDKPVGDSFHHFGRELGRTGFSQLFHRRCRKTERDRCTGIQEW